MIKINKKWQIVSSVFCSYWSFHLIYHMNKEKQQFETKQLRKGMMGFAPVRFRVMMFEIFLLIALVLHIDFR